MSKYKQYKVDKSILEELYINKRLGTKKNI